VTKSDLTPKTKNESSLFFNESVAGKRCGSLGVGFEDIRRSGVVKLGPSSPAVTGRGGFSIAGGR